MTTRILGSRFARLVVVGALASGAAIVQAPAGEHGEFRYDASNVDVAAHWAARATLANAVMFSGLGEPIVMSASEWDDVLRHAGYVTRPPTPGLPMVGGVYAGGDPRFAAEPDFGKLETLVWDPASFDRTLDPGAQAWALIKITSPEFHLNFHESKDDKRIALMMLSQAQAQAGVLEERLRNADGRFAALSPEGRFAEPKPADQPAVLWSVSNLILAATSERDDYWHGAYRDLVDPDDWRELADAAFAAVQGLPPKTPAERAIAIEALGRFALATGDAERRDEALRLARDHADALTDVQEASLEDTALAVYGLVEADRLLADAAYADAAAELFKTRLLPRWNDDIGAFVPDEVGTSFAYTPRTLGALVAALNATRWYGPAELAKEADRFYPALFETILVRAGLLRSSPLPLVAAEYREERPDAHFAHPALPAPESAGVAPVFAGEVRYEDSAWRVSDPLFCTADAMFLANMLVMPHEGLADPFLPEDGLASLRR
jgi:hypothetical protein